MTLVTSPSGTSRLEIAVPNVSSPTGFDTYAIELNDLANTLSAVDAYTDKDGNGIVKNDSGYNYIPLGKLMGDINRAPSFSRGFNAF